MIRVVVARGGISGEHEVSLKTGESILSAINANDGFQVIDLIQTKNGRWLLKGVEIELQEIIYHADIVWNAFHGEYGEDGKFAQDLEFLNIPYVGSEPVPSAITMNKHFAKEALKKCGFLFSPHLQIKNDKNISQSVADVHAYCSPPWIVKPTNGGSSVGIRVARTFTELSNYLFEHKENDEEVIVEQFVFGREASVFVAEGYRGEQIYAFPPIEISVPKNSFFDFEMKYSGEAKEIVPGRFSEKEKQSLKSLAIKAHRELGLRYFSKSDFIVTKKGIYYLETNPLPGMTLESLAPKAINSVGGTLKDFVKHVIDRAFSKR